MLLLFKSILRVCMHELSAPPVVKFLLSLAVYEYLSVEKGTCSAFDEYLSVEKGTFLCTVLDSALLTCTRCVVLEHAWEQYNREL